SRARTGSTTPATACRALDGYGDCALHSVSLGSVRGRRLHGIHAGEDRAWSGETQLPRREAGVQGLDERDDDHGRIRADAGRDAGKKVVATNHDGVVRGLCPVEAWDVSK